MPEGDKKAIQPVAMGVEKKASRCSDSALQPWGQKALERPGGKAGIGSGKSIGHRNSLLGLGGTDTVKKQTSGAKQLCRRPEQSQLQPRHALQVGGAAAPFQLGQAPDDTETAAGRIHEDLMGWQKPGGTDVPAIEGHSIDRSEPEPLCGAFHQPQPVGVKINGGDDTAIPHQLGQVGAFARALKDRQSAPRLRLQQRSNKTELSPCTEKSPSR